MLGAKKETFDKKRKERKFWILDSFLAGSAIPTRFGPPGTKGGLPESRHTICEQ